MDSMEDSGIDSDQKPAQNGTENAQVSLLNIVFIHRMIGRCGQNAEVVVFA